MDYKKLNEELISIVEKNIDPKFRQFIKDRNEVQKQYLQKEINDKIKYSGGEENLSDYTKQKIDKLQKQKTSKHQDADRILKFLGGIIDVENCTLETIPTQGLKSGKLRKLIKSKLTDIDTKGILLCPVIGWDAEKLDSVQTFECWVNADNKLYIDPLIRQNADWPYKHNGVANAQAVNTFMADLNSGLVPAEIYFAYGTYIPKARQDKNRPGGKYNRGLQNKIPYNLYRYTGKETEYMDVDKSGYINQQKDLLKRLADYKQSKGSYNKDVEAIYSKYDELLKQYKDLVAKYDPRTKEGRVRYEIDKIQKTMGSVNMYVEWLADALDKNNGPEIEKNITYCKQALKI